MTTIQIRDPAAAVAYIDHMQKCSIMWTPTVEDIWLSNVPPYPMLHIVINGHDLAIATAGFEGSIVETILNMLGKTQIAPDAINAICLMRIDELKKEVFAYYKKHGAAYLSDIAHALNLNLRLTHLVVDQLEREGQIVTKVT
mgnify:FL=1|jgi:hypothetical protein